MYVLTELEARVFNDKAIPILVQGINESLKKKSKEEFKVKMGELKERKVYLEGKLVDIEASQSVTKVTEEDIRGLLTGFKEYVVTKNIPECKNYI